MESEKTNNQINQYLTFLLGDDTFAFNVLKTKEVLEVSKITPMPRSPKFMAGVINLRGSVVPVVDLRKKLGMPDIQRTIDTAIIIVELEFDDELLLIGALVDAVQSVIMIGSEDIEPAPKMGMNLNSELVEGIGKYNDNFVIILEIINLFSEKELSLFVGTSDDTIEPGEENSKEEVSQESMKE